MLQELMFANNTNYMKFLYLNIVFLLNDCNLKMSSSEFFRFFYISLLQSLYSQKKFTNTNGSSTCMFIKFQSYLVLINAAVKIKHDFDACIWEI